MNQSSHYIIRWRGWAGVSGVRGLKRFTALRWWFTTWEPLSRSLLSTFYLCCQFPPLGQTTPSPFPAWSVCLPAVQSARWICLPVYPSIYTVHILLSIPVKTYFIVTNVLSRSPFANTNALLFISLQVQFSLARSLLLHWSLKHKSNLIIKN